MEIKNRTDIKNFIVDIEKKFDILQWKVNDIHLWPLIRIELYFALIKSIENDDLIISVPNKSFSTKQKKIKYNLIFRIKRQLKHTYEKSQIYLKLKKATKNLRKKETVFVSEKMYRSEINGIYYNKFFDPLIADKTEKSFLFWEYGEILENFSNQNAIIDFIKVNSLYKRYLYLIFNKNKIDVFLEGYESLWDYITTSNPNLSSDSLTKEAISRQALIFHQAFQTATYLLKKVQPKKVFILWYYGFPGFAISAAANKLNIKTIEMQHGPQTDLHLAYANWTKIPDAGFDMLPRNYWCWNRSSAETIEKWSNSNPLYNIEINGNPWHSFEINIKNISENYVLYCMQPIPVSITQLIFPALINTIKNSEKKWYIRFHPRQKDEEIQEIINIIEESNISHKVNFDDANRITLPQLIKNCSFHITHFSGCALEAFILKKKTIFINEIGLHSFPEIFKNKFAYYIDYNDKNFEEKFRKIEDQINT